MKKLKEIIIVGFGGHSKVLLNILERDYKGLFKIIGYVDIEKKDSSLKYLGDDEKLYELYNKGICQNLTIGMGKINVDLKRIKLIKDLENIGFKFPNIISKKSIVNKNVKVEDGVQIFDNVVVNFGAKIGKHCILNTSSIIEHDVFIDDYTHVAPGAVVCGGAQIGKNCLIGANSTVIQSIKICDNVLLGANSLVQKDIEEKGIFFGVPAKKAR